VAKATAKFSAISFFVLPHCLGAVMPGWDLQQSPLHALQMTGFKLSSVLICTSRTVIEPPLRFQWAAESIYKLGSRERIDRALSELNQVHKT
jgi:hypothetical protein